MTYPTEKFQMIGYNNIVLLPRITIGLSNRIEEKEKLKYAN